MGSWLSKRKEEKQKEAEAKALQQMICKQTVEKLTSILTEVEAIKDSKVYSKENLEFIKDKYDEAITYVDCNEPKPEEIKKAVKSILDEFVDEVGKTINKKVLLIIKPISVNEKNGEVIIDNATDFNQSIKELQDNKSLLLVLQNTNPDSKLIKNYLITVDEKISEFQEEYSKISGTFDLYKKCIMSKLYSVGCCVNQRNNDVYDSVLKQYESLFDLDSYKYLMKFSELVPILFPIWDNNISKYTNLNDYYKNYGEQYFKNNNKSILKSLMKYYSNIVMNKPKNYNNASSTTNLYEEYVTDETSVFRKLESDVINNVIKTEQELFIRTKEIFKSLGIYHWKSIKYFAKIDLKKCINYKGQIPSNYPMYSPKIELINTIVYILNIIIKVNGNPNVGGGSFFNDPNPFTYDQLFGVNYEEPSLVIQTNDVVKNKLLQLEEICDNSLVIYDYIISDDENILYYIDEAGKNISYRDKFTDEFKNKFGLINLPNPTDSTILQRWNAVKDKLLELSTNQQTILISIYDAKIDENSNTEVINNYPPTYDYNRYLYMPYSSDSENYPIEAGGIIGAKYYINSETAIPDFRSVFDILYGLLSITNIGETKFGTRELYDSNLRYIFNCTDYMTYPTNGGDMSNAGIPYYIYKKYILDSKWFALIIPLIPGDIAKDNFDTINMKDYHMAKETYKDANDEVLFDHMFQRSSIYPKHDGSF